MVAYMDRVGHKFAHLVQSFLSDNCFNVIHFGAVAVVGQHTICEQGQKAGLIVIIAAEFVRLNDLDRLQRLFVRLFLVTFLTIRTRNQVNGLLLSFNFDLFVNVLLFFLLMLTDIFDLRISKLLILPAHPNMHKISASRKAGAHQ